MTRLQGTCFGTLATGSSATTRAATKTRAAESTATATRGTATASIILAAITFWHPQGGWCGGWLWGVPFYTFLFGTTKEIDIQSVRCPPCLSLPASRTSGCSSYGVAGSGCVGVWLPLCVWQSWRRPCTEMRSFWGKETGRKGKVTVVCGVPCLSVVLCEVVLLTPLGGLGTVAAGSLSSQQSKASRSRYSNVPKPYACTVEGCFKMYAHARSVRHHIRDHHGSGGIFLCILCRFVLSSDDELPSLYPVLCERANYSFFLCLRIPYLSTYSPDLALARGTQLVRHFPLSAVIGDCGLCAWWLDKAVYGNTHVPVFGCGKGCA